MTTFALLHGSGDSGWVWHIVQEALRRRGHDSVAPDLPTDREDATWDDCVGVCVQAVGSAEDVVVVGHSSGGFLVPLLAQRLEARLQVYVAGMVPAPGETALQWFANLGWRESVQALAAQDAGRTGSPDPLAAFYEDVPPTLAAEAMSRERPTSERLGETPWPLPTLPEIAARYVVTTRDRFIPPPVQRRAAARLGISSPDGLESGHCPQLSRPDDLADLLVGHVVSHLTSPRPR